ncbi:MAG: hypothetical protein F4203_02745 [Rhodobacteraceae bacterium]|nr:hypothetical protein [Paracoccaceae bacterium]
MGLSLIQYPHGSKAIHCSFFPC